MSHLAKDMTPSVTWKDITPGCNIFQGVLHFLHQLLGIIIFKLIGKVIAFYITGKPYSA